MKSFIVAPWVAALCPSTSSADGLNPLSLGTLVWMDVNKLGTKEKQFEGSVLNDPSLMATTCWTVGERHLGRGANRANNGMWHHFRVVQDRQLVWTRLIQHQQYTSSLTFYFYCSDRDDIYSVFNMVELNTVDELMCLISLSFCVCNWLRMGQKVECDISKRAQHFGKFVYLLLDW